MTNFDYNCGEGFACDVTYDRTMAVEADAIIYSMEQLCLNIIGTEEVSDTLAHFL